MGNVASDEGARSPEGSVSSPESTRRSARDWSPPAYASRSGARELSSVAEGEATSTPHATRSVDAESTLAEPTSRRRSGNGLVIVREGSNLDVSPLHQ
jgi:hypothetical protein